MIHKTLARLAALAILLPLGLGALAQQIYPTPMAAAEALVDGIARSDNDAVRAALGTDYRKVMGIANPGLDDVTTFLEAWAQSRRIVPAGDAKAHLEVGRYGWTLPIPIVKGSSGWAFDTAAVPDELRARRIGRNELATIRAMLAYADAQDDFKAYYRSVNRRDGYAQRLVSSPGKRDGLYWPTRPGEPESPLGSLFAQPPSDGLHGYRFRILTAQGKGAPGGAKGYMTADGMTGGYALVAWPAKWGATGVMTFIVSHDRIVRQKDLGPGTDAIARAMKAYDPDESWTKAK